MIKCHWWCKVWSRKVQKCFSRRFSLATRSIGSSIFIVEKKESLLECSRIAEVDITGLMLAQIVVKFFIDLIHSRHCLFSSRYKSKVRVLLCMALIFFQEICGTNYGKERNLPSLERHSVLVRFIFLRDMRDRNERDGNRSRQRLFHITQLR